MSDNDEIARHRQALVTLDKLREAIEARDYTEAADAADRLQARLDELQEAVG